MKLSRYLFLAIALLSLAGCGNDGPRFLFIGYARQPNAGKMITGTLKVSWGAQSVVVNPGQMAKLPFKDQTKKVVTTFGGRSVDEVTLTDEEVDHHNVFYNIAGMGEYYLVDYSKCYVRKGGAPPTARDVSIGDNLLNLKLFNIPSRSILMQHERLPLKMAVGDVCRLEEIPRQTVETDGSTDVNWSEAVRPILIRKYNAEIKAGGARR